MSTGALYVAACYAAWGVLPLFWKMLGSVNSVYVLATRILWSLVMRMDTSSTLTAREVVNGWSGEELRRILYDYGEERYAPAIARAILRAREDKPIETTLELVEIIKSAMVFSTFSRILCKSRRIYCVR